MTEKLEVFKEKINQIQNFVSSDPSQAVEKGKAFRKYVQETVQALLPGPSEAALHDSLARKVNMYLYALENLLKAKNEQNFQQETHWRQVSEKESSSIISIAEELYLRKFEQPCGSCGQLISGKYLEALDKRWHPKCFVCCECKNSFGSLEFYIKEDKPLCASCAQQN